MLILNITEQALLQEKIKQKCGIKDGYKLNEAFIEAMLDTEQHSRLTREERYETAWKLFGPTLSFILLTWLFFSIFLFYFWLNKLLGY